MKNGNYTKAKILTLIPIFALVFTVVCLVLATILEGPTDQGLIYTIFGFAGLVSLFVFPLPCLVLSIIGTIFASKAIKEGASEAKKFLVLGIIELLTHIVGVIVAISLFIVSMGV